MANFRFPTTAGLPTRADCYSQLLEKLIECQELAAMLGHLSRTESGHGDDVLASGWLGIAELLKRMQTQITKMAMNRLN